MESYFFEGGSEYDPCLWPETYEKLFPNETHTSPYGEDYMIEYLSNGEAYLLVNKKKIILNNQTLQIIKDNLWSGVLVTSHQIFPCQVINLTWDGNFFFFSVLPIGRKEEKIKVDRDFVGYF